jgi:hypothetical protein
MAVDLIQIEAPCTEKLSLTGAYIGMPIDALQIAFVGRYKSNLTASRSSDIVYDPVEKGGCRLRICVVNNLADAILMYKAG